MRINPVLIIIVFLTECAATRADESTHLGPWQLGMSRDQVTSFVNYGPYTAVESTNGLETCCAEFDGHHVNASFVFDKGGLSYIQVWNYEGRDWRQAKIAMLEVFDYFTTNYSGASIKSLSIEGAPALDHGALDAILDQLLPPVKDIGAKAQQGKEKANIRLTVDMAPMVQPKESRLHSQLVYVSKVDTYFVFLFQDRSDAPSRDAKANIVMEKF